MPIAALLGRVARRCPPLLGRSSRPSRTKRLRSPAVEQDQAVGGRLQAQLHRHGGDFLTGQPVRAGFGRGRGRLQVRHPLPAVRPPVLQRGEFLPCFLVKSLLFLLKCLPSFVVKSLPFLLKCLVFFSQVLSFFLQVPASFFSRTSDFFSLNSALPFLLKVKHTTIMNQPPHA